MGVKHLEDAGLQKVLIKKIILRTSWREGDDKVQVKIPSLTNFNPSPTDVLDQKEKPPKSSLLLDTPRKPWEPMNLGLVWFSDDHLI